jgi:NAD(P)-dependent dehydrogenase (short-subunit alcohol dehydrogenase family)
MPEVTLEGQVAVVTGAARGLGRTYVLELARHGAAVVVNDLPGARSGAVVAEVEAAGGRALVAEQDVADPDGAAAIVEAALEEFGRIDALVNNAGMLRNAPFTELTTAKVADILAVHLGGAFNVTKPAFAAMRAAGGGRIVNISSNTSFGMAGLVNYAAAKAGVLGLTAALAQEGAAHGILVNSVLPNGTSTIMDDDPIPGFEEDTRFVAAFEAVGQRFEPERTAALVTYLASGACTATGQHFSSLGGRYARVAYAVMEGWMTPPGAMATPQDVADHFDEIAAERIALLPSSIRDEFELVAAALAGAPASA